MKYHTSYWNRLFLILILILILFFFLLPLLLLAPVCVILKTKVEEKCIPLISGTVSCTQLNKVIKTKFHPTGPWEQLLYHLSFVRYFCHLVLISSGNTICFGENASLENIIFCETLLCFSSMSNIIDIIPEKTEVADLRKNYWDQHFHFSWEFSLSILFILSLLFLSVFLFSLSLFLCLM